jgi:hypothetical protein
MLSSLKRTCVDSASKVVSFFTHQRKKKRSLSLSSQDPHDSKEPCRKKGKTNCTFVSDLHRMTIVCLQQRRQIVDMLWICCLHLFADDVYLQYLIFSLSIYLLDALILEEFMSQETELTRGRIHRFSPSALHAMHTDSIPSIPFCCLILAAKVDTANKIRVRRNFHDLSNQVDYYLHMYKSFDTQRFCVFHSDDREGKQFRHVSSHGLRTDPTLSDEELSEVEYAFCDRIHFLLLTGNPHRLTKQYLLIFQSRVLQECFQLPEEKSTDQPIPLHKRPLPHASCFPPPETLGPPIPIRPLPVPQNGWQKPPWIFPNPCLFRKEAAAAGATTDDEFRRIGEIVRLRHREEFSFCFPTTEMLL